MNPGIYPESLSSLKFPRQNLIFFPNVEAIQGFPQYDVYSYQYSEQFVNGVPMVHIGEIACVSVNNYIYPNVYSRLMSLYKLCVHYLSTTT
jgi:hypothetical protein